MSLHAILMRRGGQRGEVRGMLDGRHALVGELRVQRTVGRPGAPGGRFLIELSLRVRAREPTWTEAMAAAWLAACRERLRAWILARADTACLVEGKPPAQPPPAPRLTLIYERFPFHGQADHLQRLLEELTVIAAETPLPAVRA